MPDCQVGEQICSRGRANYHQLTGFDQRNLHTVTSDNGKEFAKHESIAKNLDAQFFFANPYASWERGLNENTNGLIRQYFPKKTQFNHISDQQVQSVMEKLNNCSRK